MLFLLFKRSFQITLTLFEFNTVDWTFNYGNYSWSRFKKIMNNINGLTFVLSLERNNKEVCISCYESFLCILDHSLNDSFNVSNQHEKSKYFGEFSEFSWIFFVEFSVDILIHKWDKYIYHRSWILSGNIEL